MSYPTRLQILSLIPFLVCLTIHVAMYGVDGLWIIAVCIGLFIPPLLIIVAMVLMDDSLGYISGIYAVVFYVIFVYYLLEIMGVL